MSIAFNGNYPLPDTPPQANKLEARPRSCLQHNCNYKVWQMLLKKSNCSSAKLLDQCLNKSIAQWGKPLGQHFEEMCA